MVDTHLGNAVAGGFHIAEIAASDPIKTGMDSGNRLTVFQARQPALKGFALDDLEHGNIVTHG
jgi:hypothetical protein